MPNEPTTSSHTVEVPADALYELLLHYLPSLRKVKEDGLEGSFLSVLGALAKAEESLERVDIYCDGSQLCAFSKIHGIKFIRTITDMGLKEAKDAVEGGMILLKSVARSDCRHWLDYYQKQAQRLDLPKEVIGTKTGLAARRI